jgi:hypothetical protein
MNFHPNYIILKQTLRYLTEDEGKVLKDALLKLKGNNKTFLNCITKHFDIEKFKKKPLVWQDIWLYNYIKYETSERIKRSGLIARYAREVFIDNDEEFFKKKDYINSLKILNGLPLQDPNKLMRGRFKKL